MNDLRKVAVTQWNSGCKFVIIKLLFCSVNNNMQIYIRLGPHLRAGLELSGGWGVEPPSSCLQTLIFE